MRISSWHDRPGPPTPPTRPVPSSRRCRAGCHDEDVFVRLHHVQLAMPPGEEDRARSFYGAVLGLAEIDKPPVLAARGGVWFRGGGVEVHLGVEDGFRPARKAHPGMLVGNLDDIVRRLAAAGVDVIPDGEFPGHRRIYCADPFGNRL